MKNSHDCKFKTFGGYCDHRYNRDKRTSPSPKNRHLKKKRCLNKFCPLKYRYD